MAGDGVSDPPFERAANDGEAGGASLVKTPEQRQAELWRMRAIATSLLFLMTIIFVAMRFAPPNWAFAPYVSAFAEAGMVGACADWFAVTALFRHPLGVPIPHTAIVPENRKRLGASLGRFVANNFLSPRVMAERLRTVDPVRLAAGWLSAPQNGAAIAAAAARYAPQALAALPEDAVARWVGAVALRGAEAVPVAPLASRALSVLWANGAGQGLLDQGLDLAEDTLARNREAIVDQVRRQASPWIPKWVDEIIATTVLRGLTSTLSDMRRPDHPWRGEVGKRVAWLVEALANDPDMRAKSEALKRDVLANPAFRDQAGALWRELDMSLRREQPERLQALAASAIEALASFVRAIDEDPARRERVNDWLRRAVLQIVLPRRLEVGGYIEQVVDRWDTKTLVNRLELQVGRDLQYIRINGTLVGGLVGLAIYSITRAFGF